MKNIFLIIVLVMMVAYCRPHEKTENNPPNIVIILADDMGYGDIEAYNPGSKIPTPNLNTLAEEGMMFTDAHTNSAVCTPTRYGILTGRYAWRTRLKKGVLGGYSAHLIAPGRMTIASLLKQKGYNTGVVGKWHLGVDFPWLSGIAPEGHDRLLYYPEKTNIDYTKPVRNGPNDIGFDYSFIIPGSLDMGPYVYLENGKATAIPDSICPREPFPAYHRKGEIAPGFVHEQALDTLTQKAVAFIRKQTMKNRPFLLYFPLTAPHKPALPARRFAGKSGFGPYGDMILQVDWTVGKILQTLKETGLEDNTLVLYTSDNGSYMYRIDEAKPDHVDNEKVEGYHINRRQANYIWRGTKADIYEAGHRVPFIVKWPGRIEKGSKSTATICTTDIFMTLAEITGAERGQGAAPDSYSFAPLLFGREGQKRPPVVHHSVNGSFSIRESRWKLILTNGSGGRQKPVGKPFERPYQLYDLSEDPSEKHNVYEAHSEIAERLLKEVDKIRYAEK